MTPGMWTNGQFTSSNNEFSQVKEAQLSAAKHLKLNLNGIVIGRNDESDTTEAFRNLNIVWV